MKQLIVASFLLILVLTPILVIAESPLNSEDLDLSKVDAKEINIDEFNIDELNISDSITLRGLLGVIIDKVELIETDNPLLKYLLPRALKIVPSDTNEPFILLISKEGLAIMDETEYAGTLDFEAGALVSLSDKSIRIDYLRPNSFIACVLVSILGRQHNVRIENTDTRNYKIANFLINIACGLSGQCKNSNKVPLEIKFND